MQRQQLNEPLRDSFSNLEVQNYKLITFLSDIVFRKKGHYPMMKLMEQACPEEICQQVIKSYRKEFKKQIFQIEVSLHSRSWIIKKRLEDFVELEKKLKDKYKKKIPHMPVKKQTGQDNFQLLEDFFILFLQSACKIEIAHDDLDLLLFIQVPIIYNRSTFWDSAERIKTYLQIYSKKRSGGRFNEYNCRRCIALFTNWKKRFFTISTQGIFYSSGHTEEQSAIKEMLLFSYDFSMTYGLNETGYKWGINLHGCQRILHIKTNNWYQFCLFILAIKLSLKQNGYLQNNRFQSFAPPRQNCDSQYYIDGENYFKAIYNQISNAKSQVFITGWMLTPFYMLCRPNHIESQFRFDKLLQRVANKGIKVYIILFLQPKLALNNDSEYTKFYLESLHSNIKVLRHPPFVVIPFLWSHHEKIVIIDQRIGFIGGLDICYGRFDNSNHKLSDEEGEIKYWEGADYCNLRISDVYTPRQYEVSLINRNYDPRLPWHDVTVQLRGDSVIDLSRHFIQYWNFVNFQTKFDQRELLIQVGIVLPEVKQQQQMLQQANENNQKVEQGRQKLRQDVRRLQSKNKIEVKQQVLEQPVPPELKVKRSISQGLQLIAQITDKDFSRQMSARYDQKLTQNQKHLGQIIANDEKEKAFYREYLKLQKEKSGKNDKKKIQKMVQKKFDKLKKELTPLNPFTDEQPVESDIVLAGSKTITKGNMKHQILRSSSHWSLGLKQGFQQRSIYNSLISMITKAQHYIYIENQFFICVENHVSEALRERIELAHKTKSKFKVIIVLPLLPAFEGQVDSSSSTVLKVQLHWQFQTICRGGRSLLERLSHIQNLDEYIQFYSLRTHGEIAKRPVTQIIYVHSKLIIVDDRVMLIGSANINDRSLLGTRDSEIGLIIEDKDELQITHNNNTHRVKKFPYSLRVQLFQQHFGLSFKQASDLVYDDDVWYMVKQRANKNTALYRQIFAVYPDDNVKSLSDLPQFKKKRDLHKYQLMKQLIQGNVVQFPKDFLLYQNLKPRPNQKQYYVPEISFT